MTGQVLNPVARRVNAEVVVVLGWGRAILMQVAHPLIAAGVAEHSDFGEGATGYLRRSYRTINAMLELTFGSSEVVKARADAINQIHQRVHGQLADEGTALPHGTAYSATDPSLLQWVHATLIETQLSCYQLFVGDLSQSERNAYCAEAAQVGPLLGIPEGLLPAPEDDLRKYLDSMLSSGVIEVTDTARRLASALLKPPGFFLKVMLAPGRLTTAALLPKSLRDAYRLPWGPAHQRRFTWLLRGSQVVRPLTPRLLREWPAARRAPMS